MLSIIVIKGDYRIRIQKVMANGPNKYKLIHLSSDHQRQIIEWRETWFNFCKCEKKFLKSELQCDYQKEQYFSSYFT